MADSVRDLEHAAQVQFVRAQKVEQKAEDIQHAVWGQPPRVREAGFTSRWTGFVNAGRLPIPISA